MAEGGSSDNNINNKEKKLMVAIDESECSHYALEWALDNLPDYISSSPSSSLYIFTVQNLADFSYLQAASLGSSPPELLRAVQEQNNNCASALLKKAKDICASRGVTPKTISEVGDPKEVICSAVEKFNINLLVIGNNGKGAIKRAFLGSVSNYCVHNAKCPVLVVKKPA
ncbi:Universal stress protein a-like protein [Thalictrum thalictroides]|uniref:Universal stress protein a-like protein n=1 Tax=Thalictrum thalictroides TaxID=46969 RepID=A0A7J6XCT2_THATH|nr:Universal stress protein a-like protein [Thalictrum thalictroides]